MVALRKARLSSRLRRLGRSVFRPSVAARIRLVTDEVREAARRADLTASTHVQDLHERCRRRLRGGADRLLIDLTVVTAMDTKLVACLVVLKREAQRRGAEVEILCSSQVRNWLRIYRVDALLGPELPVQVEVLGAKAREPSALPSGGPAAV